MSIKMSRPSSKKKLSKKKSNRSAQNKAVHEHANSISKSTKLLLNQGESEYADFKRSSDGITSDDLVAFANSPKGGVILVGVDESAGPNGAQHGVVTGCDVSDSAALIILNKAISCIPPVAIQIEIENLKAKSIFRINIPSSSKKPHCTPKGIYCCRDGSRNRPLHPAELLKIFLENEGKAFAERFEEAANKITDELASLESTLQHSIDSMSDQLGWAESQLGNTESTIDSIYSQVRDISTDADDTTKRLRALFRQDNREDPIRKEVADNLSEKMLKQLSENSNLLKQVTENEKISLNLTNRVRQELNDEELKKIIKDVVEKLNAKTKD